MSCRRSMSRLLLVIGCATGCVPGAGPAPDEPAARPEGWTVGLAEHVALWYHGRAYTTAAVDARAPVLPYFRPGYVDEIVEAKRRMGVYPTVLDRRASEFGELFEGADAYDALEFLPLYFQDGEALASAIDLWQRAGGDPRRAGSGRAARVVAFLSELFPRAEQRRVVAAWVDVLAQERDAFYDAHWEQRRPELRRTAAAVQEEWDALAPELETYLDYIQLEGGDLLLVPALGPEGRTVTSGPSVPRAAIMTPGAGRSAEAVWSFVHELLYPLVGEVVREYVAPVRIRQIGEDVLLTRSAVRGGAMLLERVAPQRAPRYRRFFLRQARPDGAADADGGAAAQFEQAFPLPEGLEEGLAETIEAALAGI